MTPCVDCQRPVHGTKSARCCFCRQEARRAFDRARRQANPTKYSVRPQNTMKPLDWDTARIERRLAELDAEAKQRRWRIQ